MSESKGRRIEEGALEGIKIIDFSWLIAAPLATRFLADHGATVIKVESLSKPDGTRTSPPFKDGKPGVDRSSNFADYNINKYSISLDLKKPKALGAARRLVNWADVVVHNFTPGVMERLGLGYEELRKMKPDIIVASTNQLGSSGPYSAFSGLGTQAAALGGFWSVTGWPDGEPIGPYGAYVDSIALHYLLIAILVALDYRHQTGKGQYIEQSQLESGLQFFAPALLDYGANGRVWGREGNRDPYACPHGTYRCFGDDRWCVIAVSTDTQWQNLCQAMERPLLAVDPRFNSFLLRKRNENELDKLVEDWTSVRSPEEVMYVLQQNGVPSGIVSKGEDLHRDLQLLFRNHFWWSDHPVIGRHSCEAPPFRLSDTPSQLSMPSPCLGEHNEYVCTKILGMTDQEFVELVGDGIFE